MTSPTRTQRYGCKDKPGAVVTLTVPADAETPAQIEIRYPDEDYRRYVFWWHYAPVVDERVCTDLLRCDHCSWCHAEVPVAVLRDGSFDGFMIGESCKALAEMQQLKTEPYGRRLTEPGQ